MAEVWWRSFTRRSVLSSFGGGFLQPLNVPMWVSETAYSLHIHFRLFHFSLLASRSFYFFSTLTFLSYTLLHLSIFGLLSQPLFSFVLFFLALTLLNLFQTFELQIPCFTL